MYMILNLDISLVKVDDGNALLNISTSIRLNLIGRTFKNPSTILSETKWQSISVFCHFMKVGLDAMAIAA